MSTTAASIRVESGPHAGSTHPVQAGSSIGRGASCAVPLPDDDEVSRQHAVIEVEEGSFRLRDLQSRNGTTLNGARVDAAPLRDGDLIHVGGSRLRFELAEARPASPRPTEEAASREASGGSRAASRPAGRNGGRARRGGGRSSRRRAGTKLRVSEVVLFGVLLVLCYLIARTLADVVLVVADRIRPG